MGHRYSWGILPQTPVFSLRSACCHWGTAPSLSGLNIHVPKPLLVSQLYPRQRAERSEKTGVWGRITQEVRCPDSFFLYFVRSKNPEAYEGPVSKSALPTTARRAKRENGGLGEDPPGSPMSHLSYRSGNSQRAYEGPNLGRWPTGRRQYDGDSEERSFCM